MKMPKGSRTKMKRPPRRGRGPVRPSTMAASISLLLALQCPLSRHQVDPLAPPRVIASARGPPSPTTRTIRTPRTTVPSTRSPILTSVNPPLLDLPPLPPPPTRQSNTVRTRTRRPTSAVVGFPPRLPPSPPPPPRFVVLTSTRIRPCAEWYSVDRTTSLGTGRRSTARRPRGKSRDGPSGFAKGAEGLFRARMR